MICHHSYLYPLFSNRVHRQWYIISLERKSCLNKLMVGRSEEYWILWSGCSIMRERKKKKESMPYMCTFIPSYSFSVFRLLSEQKCGCCFLKSANSGSFYFRVTDRNSRKTKECLLQLQGRVLTITHFKH